MIFYFRRFITFKFFFQQGDGDDILSQLISQTRNSSELKSEKSRSEDIGEQKYIETPLIQFDTSESENTRVKSKISHKDQIIFSSNFANDLMPNALQDEIKITGKFYFI